MIEKTKGPLAARASACVALVLAAAACSPLIAPYNETAYQYATSLKPEALMLMDKATEDYAAHADDAEVLLLKVEQAYEYVAAIPNNEDSAGQWRILKDPEGQLLGGFLRRWEAEGTLDATFIQNAKDDLVAPAFDRIIALEALKIQQ